MSTYSANTTSHEDEQDALLDLFSLKILFQGCVISDSYVLNPTIPNAVRLSTAGQKHFRDICRRQPKLAVTDAKMLTFLEMDSPEGLLVEGLQSDLASIQKALGDSLTSQKILYPWTYGRQLTDEVVRSLRDLKPNLDNKETVALLKSTPPGVFQVGRYVVGPFGCLRSPFFRSVYPKKHVDGYYEVRDGRKTFRKFKLQTGDQAKINKAANVDEKLRAKSGSIDTNLSQAYRALTREYSNRVSKHLHFQDDILWLLGETLSDAECRTVLSHLLPLIFKREGGSRTLEKQLGTVIGDPDKFVATMTRQEIQQLFHLGSNQELYLAVEKAISMAQIDFKEGVSRFSAYRKGFSKSRLELTPDGVRNASWFSDSTFSTNALDILFGIFEEACIKKPEDLKFRLNSQETDTDLLLREALLSWSVEDFVGYLCGDFELAIFCANRLGVFEPEKLGNEQLKRKMIFKLGAPLIQISHQIDDFERLLGIFTLLDGSDENLLSSASVNVFKSLETILFDTTVFLRWALISPKSVQDFDFELDLSKERESHRASFGSSSLTLKPLIDGLSTLRTELRDLPKEEMIPQDRLSITSGLVRPDVFKFRRMFHNLNRSSQSSIMEALNQVFGLLCNDVVTSIRNRTVHGNQAQAISRTEILAAAESLKKAVVILQSNGFTPTPWSYSGSSIDMKGLRRISYKNRVGECSIYLPSLGNAPGLPSRRRSLYIMNCAELSYAGPLRFAVAEPPINEHELTGFPPEVNLDSEGIASMQLADDNSAVA
jgi:hypothetical protein